MCRKARRSKRPRREPRSWTPWTATCSARPCSSHASIANSRPASNVIKQLTGDGWLLFATRFVRLFAYGSLSVVLVFYLVGVGLSEAQAGLLLSLTLVGDTAVSLFLTTQADRLGRRRMLIAGAALMTIAGVVFAASRTFWILLLAGHHRRDQPERAGSRAVSSDRTSLSRRSSAIAPEPRAWRGTRCLDQLPRPPAR